MESRRVRLVAANIGHFEWSATAAKLLYSLAPPPPSPMDEWHAVMDGHDWRLHDAATGADTAVAGAEREFAHAGPWGEPERLLFWRISFGVVDELFAFDATRGAARRRHTLVRENVLQFAPRPFAGGWAMLTSALDQPRCLRAREVDGSGRIGRSLLRGCSYVCAPGPPCVAWADEGTLVMARSDWPGAATSEWWGWQEHPVSLVARDLRTGKEERLLHGSPGLTWTLVGARSGEVMIVQRCLTASVSLLGRARECELQARSFAGNLVGTLHRGDDPPAFVGFVR